MRQWPLVCDLLLQANQQSQQSPEEMDHSPVELKLKGMRDVICDVTLGEHGRASHRRAALMWCERLEHQPRALPREGERRKDTTSHSPLLQERCHASC